MSGGYRKLSYIAGVDKEFQLKISADEHCLERASGNKESTCRPMDPDREAAAYETINSKSSWKDTEAVSSNAYKSKHGACMHCHVIYKWTGLPAMCDALCSECGRQLSRRRSRAKNMLLRFKVPVTCRMQDERTGTCGECEVIYEWIGLPTREDAECPECGATLKKNRIRRMTNMRRIFVTPERRVFDD